MFIAVVLFSIHVQINGLFKFTVARERTGENYIIRTIFRLWRHDLLSVRAKRRRASINSIPLVSVTTALTVNDIGTKSLQITLVQDNSNDYIPIIS